MIARLRGEVVEIASSRLVLDVSGVGYEVHVPTSIVSDLMLIGEPVTLHIRTQVREDAITLYGFDSPTQRRLFDLLTDVKGCGPKTALSLLGELGEATVVSSLLQGDTRTLARASGVGPRLAERLVLELKEKVSADRAQVRTHGVPHATPSSHHPDDDLLQALLSLGYRRSEAEAAAAAARETEKGVENQIRAALRLLSTSK